MHRSGYSLVYPYALGEKTERSRSELAGELPTWSLAEALYRYALVSSQGKGQPKYVRMRGQTVEEVLTKTEHTSAVSLVKYGGRTQADVLKETGAVLRDGEIGQAYQFGKETTVPNILEPNWWESTEHQQEQQAVADEALRLNEERRRREEEGEEDKEMPEVEEKMKSSQGKKANGKVEEKPRVIARTRVSRSHSTVKGAHVSITSSYNLRTTRSISSSRWV